MSDTPDPTQEMSVDDLVMFLRNGDQAVYDTAVVRLKGMLDSSYNAGYHVGFEAGARTGFEDGYKLAVDDMATAASNTASQLKKSRES